MLEEHFDELSDSCYTTFPHPSQRLSFYHPHKSLKLCKSWVSAQHNLQAL